MVLDWWGMDRGRNGRNTSKRNLPSGGERNAAGTARSPARVLVAALAEGEDLSELGELLRTAGVAVVGEMVQRREQPHPNTYLGPGKVAEAKAAAAARRERDRM